MKKILCLFIAIILMSANGYCADTKVEDLTELTAEDGSDLLYIVDDPGVTPLGKYITIDNLFDAIDTSAELVDYLQDEDGSGLCGANLICIGGHEHAGANLTDDILLKNTTDTLTGILTVTGTAAVTTITKGGVIVYNDDEMDAFSELDAIVTDKALVNKADGAVWLGVHDLGGATSLEIPNSADPDVDAEGEISWDSDDDTLRGYDGTGQVSIAQSQKTIQFTIATPLDLDEADTLKVWENTSGLTFNIGEIRSSSDTDDVDYALNKAPFDDYGTLTLIGTQTVSTDGAAVYYDNDSTHNNSTIETGYVLLFNNDATDDPDSLSVVITGTFNADVN